MSELLEILMIVAFGISWPVNGFKAYRSRTAKGTSLSFLYMIFFGYIAGIASKLCSKAFIADISSKWYVLFFYVLNLITVVANICIFFRNKRIDAKS